MKNLKVKNEKVSQLVDEYKEDPNCWPALWIQGEDVTENERQLFIQLAIE